MTIEREARALDIETLAVAMNTAMIQPEEIRLGRDLRVPATRIVAALERATPPSPVCIETQVVRGIGEVPNLFFRCDREARHRGSHHGVNANGTELFWEGDAQAADLLEALAERRIYSRGDLEQALDR